MPEAWQYFSDRLLPNQGAGQGRPPGTNWTQGGGSDEQFNSLFDILQQQMRSGQVNPNTGYGQLQQIYNRLSPRYASRLSNEWAGMEQQRQIGDVYSNIAAQQNLAQSQLNQAGQYLQNNNQAVMGDYARARGEINSVGQQAQSDIGRRGAQQQAGVMQGLQARGLGNTSILQNAQRGVASDTARNYQGLNESLAGLRGGLAERQGGMRNQLGQQMGDFMRYRTGLETGLLGQHGDFTRSRVEARDRNLLAQMQAASLAQAGSGTAGQNAGIWGGLLNAAGTIGGAWVGA